jgi:hypothetical protein
MSIHQKRHDHSSIYRRLSTIRPIHKRNRIFRGKTADDYKLTLNDPYPIDECLGIHLSHQDNGELHMSQTWLIDAATESAHIPKGS